ncbi:MAG: PQQ-binding-like beta-propeller repeat protein, partial [Thermoguttaceae bacterium]|nr:PQQ-binding-like beta-propeller repeat protein [Thermoguttaceae bacterium]
MMSEQTQSVLDVSPVKNLKGFYRLCVVGTAFCTLVCLVFLVFLIGNYFAPYSLSRLDSVLASQANQHNSKKSETLADDFVLDGPQTGKKENETPEPGIERKTLAERFPFAFLTLPTEHKEFLALREKLLLTPNDLDLQARVRAADLILRQQYFLKRARARTGAILFLISLGAGLLFASTASSLKRRLPVVKVSQECEHHRQMNQQLDRIKAVVSLGVLGGVGIGLVLGLFLSGRSELESFLDTKIAPTKPVGSPVSDSNVNVSAKSAAESAVPAQVAAGDAMPQAPSPAGVTLPTAAQAIVEEPAVDPAKDKEKFVEIWSRNWGAFRGPLASGIENEKSLAGDEKQPKDIYVDSWDVTSGENIVWKSPVPLEGHNSPVIWGERIFLTGASEAKRQVFCFHRTTGKLLWATSVPEVGNKIGADSLNADTGLAASTVVTDGRRVYAIFPNADIAAIDFSGKLVWSKNLGNAESQYGYASSLALWFDRVIVQIDVESKE